MLSVRLVDESASAACDRNGGAEDHSRRHLHHQNLLPRLVHRDIIQPSGATLYGLRGRSRRTSPRRHQLLAEGLQDRPMVGRILVSRDQPRHQDDQELNARRGPAPGPTPPCAPAGQPTRRAGTPDRTRHSNSSRTKPIVGLVVVAILLLLGDERARLVDLDLAGLGRAGRPARRGRRGRAHRRRGCAVRGHFFDRSAVQTWTKNFPKIFEI